MNYRIKVIVQGDHAEHEIISPRMTKEDAERDLATLKAATRGNDPVDLAWLTARPASIISAHIDAVSARA